MGSLRLRLHIQGSCGDVGPAPLYSPGSLLAAGQRAPISAPSAPSFALPLPAPCVAFLPSPTILSSSHTGRPPQGLHTGCSLYPSAVPWLCPRLPLTSSCLCSMSLPQRSLTGPPYGKSGPPPHWLLPPGSSPGSSSPPLCFCTVRTTSQCLCVFFCILLSCFPWKVSSVGRGHGRFCLFGSRLCPGACGQAGT